MSDGRTIWRAKDSLWHEREWIVTLVDEFGPSGYAVIDYLEAMAKLQKDGGRVKTGPRGISRATGVDIVTVGHVMSRSVTLGLIDEYEDRDGRFTCRITWFEADQSKAMAADRKRRQRSGVTESTGDSSALSRSVTLGHGRSRSVTECPPTEQNRTGQEEKTNNNVGPLPDRSSSFSDVRDVFSYWQQACQHQNAKLTPERQRKIEDRLKAGYTVEEIKSAIDGAAVGAFISDNGKRHDDIELICRNGSKLESFIGRTAPTGDRQPTRDRVIAGQNTYKKYYNPDGTEKKTA